jgi:hypothetical protein
MTKDLGEDVWGADPGISISALASSIPQQRDFTAIAERAATLSRQLSAAVADADALAKLIAVGPNNPSPHHGYRLNEARNVLKQMASTALSEAAFEFHKIEALLRGL